jgi:uncharacterized repeat protein (TIGR03803 family)
MPQGNAIVTRDDSTNFKVLHTFQGKPNDGAFPLASLVDMNGTLYGTTLLGGTDHAGTVFSVTKNGTVQLLHSFTKAPDGAHPEASLIDVKGTLYGTTYGGGGERRGTVFSVTAGGVEQVLHRFLGKGTHGGHPVAALVDVNGTLYGTTRVGGHYRDGTVFSVTTSGTETVLHNFDRASGPWFPVASLVDVGGTLYGTAEYGGAYNNGVVFSITPDRAFNVVYSFGNGTDGKNPRAGLIDVGGTLYGTTSSGGTYNEGTVFSLTPSGTETVLHSFGNGSDGRSPYTSLVDVGGTLYGTTEGGGSSSCSCGTVYSISGSGAETILHGFTGGSGGSQPNGLVAVGGVLYGTTEFGGSSKQCHYHGGCGLVFASTP